MMPPAAAGAAALPVEFPFAPAFTLEYTISRPSNSTVNVSPSKENGITAAPSSPTTVMLEPLTLYEYSTSFMVSVPLSRICTFVPSSSQSQLPTSGFLGLSCARTLNPKTANIINSNESLDRLISFSPFRNVYTSFWIILQQKLSCWYRGSYNYLR